MWLITKTSPIDNHVIQRLIVQSPMSSGCKHWYALLAKDVEVSQRTVSRRLVEKFGLKALKSTKKIG